MKLREFLFHRRMPWIAALIAVLLCLPAVWTGLNGDDYFHRSLLEQVDEFARRSHPILDLFVFVPDDDRRDWMFETGFLPWWADPELNIGFLRPVTAATHVLDHTLWPDNPAVQHVHSLLWFALAVLMVGALYRRVHGGGAVAGLAVLLFALEDAHAMPAGWLANRNSLLTLVFAAAVVFLHLRWRRSRRTADALPPLLVLTVGLLCGEATLGAVAYVAAWQLTMDTGPWSRRLGALVPYGVLVVAWRVAYDLMGYGSQGSGLYLDPGQQPLRFLVALAERWPLLLAGQWFQVPVDIWAVFHRGMQIGLSAMGGALCLGVLFLMWRLLRERRTARFWALGMALSLVPVCAAFPMSRLLIHAGVGAFGLLAMLAASVGLFGQECVDEGRVRRWGAMGMLVLHGPLAALGLLTGVATLPVFGALFATGAEAAPMDEQLEEQTLIFVNGNEFSAVYTRVIRTLDGSGPVPRRVAILAPMHNDNTLVREDEHTLAATIDGGMFANAFDRLMRNPDLAPFAVGDRVGGPDFDAEVRAVTSHGRPTEVAFRFHEPLESPEYRWVCWRPTGFAPFELPAVGQSASLPMVNVMEAAEVHRRSRIRAR